MTAMRAGAVLVAFILWASPAGAASDPLGSAGPFRSVAWAQCPAGPVEQGACDPAPVDPGLPPARQSRAHVARALTLISFGRMPQARESVDAAVKLDPRNVSALKLRARFELPGDGATAEADVNAGLAIDPNDSDLLAMRALFLEGRGDVGRALDEAGRAVRNNPRNTDALWIRARIFLANKRYDAAHADLTTALNMEPDYFHARHLRSAVRMHLKRYADALEDANRALLLQPGDVSALGLRAMVRSELGDFARLISDLTEVLGEPGQPVNADPSLAMFNTLYIRRAMALARLGRHSEAMQDIATVSLLGGQKAILRIQIYLRGSGFPDVPLNGERSQLFDDAMKACFVNQACGRDIAR